MHVLKLSTVVCSVIICLQLSCVIAHEEADIEELHYSRGEIVESDVPYWAQLLDVFQFQVADISEDTAVSLFLFDTKERTWVEASVNKEESEQYCSDQEKCKKTITLTKPLIGYDLLKPRGCEEEDLKEQPFAVGRWETRYRDEEKERAQCYMVTVSVNNQSISQTYPDNCVEEEEAIAEAEDIREAPEHTSGKSLKRNTIGTSITKFKKYKINNDRKFVCKVAHTHMGASTSLGNPILGADVKIYYKPRDNAGWGSYLLDLGWHQFSDGEDKFVGWVSKQHLNQQGVKWSKCFKCQVNINGVVTRECQGDCTCN